MLVGCHTQSHVETTAEKLCRSQFGIATRRFAPGTVGQVRALRHSAFRHAFPDLQPSASVAWCIWWRRAGGTFASDVVSATGDDLHFGGVKLVHGAIPQAGPRATGTP
jgi:hypothetical protein